ncbi:hypothetical protein HHL24_06510 [Paraburkholderia sp. RP-4-7]|uniref:Uncharacterized protein n=1 Tax=Paraburkholderia polaris TaxID=2728848 RepID=A0A848I5I4_9BURK|nr:hypothetical protein [Paraburkholderia polaris]NML97601.1 hypothetical protein [Paraburkholderia polaris]
MADDLASGFRRAAEARMNRFPFVAAMSANGTAGVKRPCRCQRRSVATAAPGSAAASLIDMNRIRYLQKISGKATFL